MVHKQCFLNMDEKWAENSGEPIALAAIHRRFLPHNAKSD